MKGLETAWYAVAASEEAPRRHVIQARLLGRPLAVWRADDGHVNVWEDRCLHRGVRLSLGRNEGAELVCQYHGWRYASRSAGCTYIPAHPADAPARTVRNRTYQTIEQDGLIWTRLGADGDAPPPCRPAPAAGARRVGLRPIWIAAPPASVTAVLDEAAARLADLGAPWIVVQPVDGRRAILRGHLDVAESAPIMPILRRADRALTALRDRLEHGSNPGPMPLPPAFEPVDPALATVPAAAADGRALPIRVQVTEKRTVSEGVAAFTLTPLEDALPALPPGAHIDLGLPNGMIRQYSLVNGPDEVDAFRIAVARVADSRGGSAALHETVREGDVLTASLPHASFPLRRDATRTLLIAGGIGVTPLLSMAKTLAHARALGRPGADVDAQIFVRSAAHLAFPEDWRALCPDLTVHAGLSLEATVDALRHALADPPPGAQIYLCGPAPMMAAAQAEAAAAGWPETAVHFEAFGNAAAKTAGPAFEVALARSLKTVHVGEDETLLAALRRAGVAMPSSCEQGACGVCRAQVIEGTPDHRDVRLSAADRARGDVILTCVSRARSARLTLDL